MSYQDLFLKVLIDHEESDVVIFCKARQQSFPVKSSEVEFFCHKDVLKRCCSVFADADEFDTLSGANRHTAALQGRSRRRFELWADDDVVFEVLRYIYCGAIFFPMRFRARFAHFLAVVDFLGIEDMAERKDDMLELGPNFVGRALPRTSMFAEIGLQQWLQDLQREDLVSFLQDDLVAGTLDHGVGAVGFSLLCSLITQLLHLRPQDLTTEALGESLYRRLENFGCHQTSDGIYGNDVCTLHLSSRPPKPSSSEHRKRPSSTPSSAPVEPPEKRQRSGSEECKAWLENIGVGDVLMQYWDKLQSEFDAELTQVKACIVKDEAGRHKFEPAFFEALGVEKAGHKFLFSKGISKLL